MKALSDLHSVVDLMPYGGKVAGLIQARRHAQANVLYGYVVEANEDLSRLGYELRKYVSDGQLYAVRSSGIGEDSGGASFAGQHLTLLNVPYDGLMEAIGKVRASAVASIEYANALDVKHETQMPVLIQPMLTPQYAGVWFGIDVTGDDFKRGRLEYVEGLADKLVGGTQKPKESLSVLDTEYGRRKLEPWQRQVLAECRRMSAVFGRAIDVEWVLYEGLTYILQMRPLSIRALEACELLGQGIGMEAVDGQVQRMPAISAFVAGNVLVTTMTTPDMIREMIAASAIVTEIGGRTCHAALVARELGKPCVIGCEKAVQLVNGQWVRVDAKAGTVVTIEKAVR